MRLWSLHPRYLDRRALVALWREGLLAQAVLRRRTRGYRNHPQLTRFRRCRAPLATLAGYLEIVRQEGARRGYAFDRALLARCRTRVSPLPVAREQIRFEWTHLRAKVAARDPEWLPRLATSTPDPHPLFRVVPGAVEPWERGATGAPPRRIE